MLSLLVVLTLPAEARPQRVDQIPNGEVFRCLTCHNQPTGGARNAMGQQVEDTLIGAGMTGVVDWPAVAPLDADGDGLTNGEELGDPDGDGVADGGPVTNPANPNDPPDDPGTDGGPGDSGRASEDEPSGCSTAPASFGGLTLGLLAGLSRRRRRPTA